MVAKNIFKVTYSNGEVQFINANSLSEAKMIAYDQTGEEFNYYGLPEKVEPAEETEYRSTRWYNDYRLQCESESEIEIFGY